MLEKTNVINCALNYYLYHSQSETTAECKEQRSSNKINKIVGIISEWLLISEKP